MKYVNQLEYPHLLYVTGTEGDEALKERGKTTTIKTSGCGLCSAVMVADRLLPGSTFDLTDAIELSYETKANWKLGTEYLRFAPAFAEKLGLRLEISGDVEDLRRCLRTGGVGVARVGVSREGQGLFTHSRHYITVIAEEADGRFAILDPSFTQEKFTREDWRDKVEVKNGVIVLCDASALVNEEATWAPPYYLFWRQ